MEKSEKSAKTEKNIKSEKINNKSEGYDNGIYYEEAYCAVRKVKFLCYYLPSSLSANPTKVENFFFRAEAMKQLTLSKYFQKFLGFDDTSNPDYEYYFYEKIEGAVNIVTLMQSVEIENMETSFFFKYIAKEILCAFRDLSNKCEFSFGMPITCQNFFYVKKTFRLWLTDIKFGPRRKTIMESQKIIEAKLLYFYALILINLLSLKYPSLSGLISFLDMKCSNMVELSKMQVVFNNLVKIEETLNRTLSSDILICIISECLLAPYKAKVVFDEFYEKKNFLVKAVEERQRDYEKDKGKYVEEEKKEEESASVSENKERKESKESKENSEKNDDEKNNDDIAMKTPYYLNSLIEKKTKEMLKKTLTINELLIHPFYSETNVDEDFLRFIFKMEDEESKKAKEKEEN